MYRILNNDNFEALWIDEPEMCYGASNLIFENAKRLRNRVKDSGGLLWERIINKPLGVNFRRQHPIFNYIADFYCHSLKLIIELAGNIHSISSVAENDKVRQQQLESFGIKVYDLRIANFIII